MCDVLTERVSWLCDLCLTSDADNPNDASLVSGPHAGQPVDDMELSQSALYARMDRLEGRIDALMEENVRLRAELAVCQSLRTDIRSLEYRIDSMTFWSVTPGRPTVPGAARPSVGGSLMVNGFGELSGRPDKTSSPASGRPSNPPIIQYRDIDLRGLGATTPKRAAAEEMRGTEVSPVRPTGTRNVLPTPGPSSLGDPAVSCLGAGGVRSDVSAQVRVMGTIPEARGLVSSGSDCASGGRDDLAAHVSDLDQRAVPGTDGGRPRGGARRAEKVKNRKRPLVMGTSSTCPLTAVSSGGASGSKQNLAWLFVTKLSLDVTGDRVTEYLASLGVEASAVYLRPPTSVRRPTYNSFRISVPREKLSGLLAPEIWPPGVGVKEWFFRAPAAN